MARRLREEAEGAVHHVWARGNRKGPIFLDDHDRATYLRLLGSFAAAHGWRCLSYCLMRNHVHLLIETPQPNLGAGMQRLHGEYAQYFNERHGLTGHVFQGRFGSSRIRSDAQLVITAAYIALNPVEAGLCERAEAWSWSSYAATIDGLAPAWLDADRLVGYFGGLSGGDGTRAFRKLVAADAT
jgi:REP element-mobilizing transposase RayT